MTPVRLLLNSGFSGANAFFALGEQRGLYQAAALDVQFTPGHGAYTAASRLAGEPFDAAYGDLNALIELAAQRPGDDLPVAVLVVHQHAPSCITVARNGPVRGPADLAGRSITGHASDVALRTFAAYARGAGLDPDSVQVETSGAAMAELLLGMLEGRTDAVFGYITTHTAALAGAGLPAETTVRFLPYREVCGALFGSALMLSPRFVRQFAGAAGALVAATRSAIVAAQAQPDAAIDAVLARSPTAVRRIEHQRWLGTLLGDIGAPAQRSGVWEGLGNTSDERLAAAIACLSQAFGWEHTVSVDQVFTRQFLSN